VRIRQGSIQVAVQQLRAGERFLVVTADAEVEVRGTHFDVEVVDDRLLQVRVSEGLVEVRREGARSVFLGANEVWSAPGVPRPSTPAASSTVASTVPPPALPATVPSPKPSAQAEKTARPSAPAASSPVASTVPPAAVPATVPSPRPSAQAEKTARTSLRPGSPRALKPSETVRIDTPPSEVDAGLTSSPEAETDSTAETLFVEGWRQLQRHEYREASRLFREVLRASPGGSLAEDAGYWLTVSLSSEGQGTEAVRAMERFLGSFPQSPRAGKVRVALGWLHLKSGARQLAKETFEDALQDADSEVREAARQGLRFLE
jgi:TolA-binding protein